MKKILLLFLIFISCFFLATHAQTEKPNVLIIYVDDLGYGDVGCYGAKGVETPNIDRLAKNGIRFTDAHCSAATCTPSRFSILTGSYAFRNKAAILPGDAPLLIRPGTETVASMLKKAGYRTGVVGKWHLGLGNGEVDWNESIKPGPLEIGFDYAFLIPATGDRVPTVYVENHQVVGIEPDDPIQVSYEEKVGARPTGTENPELLRMKADLQHSQTIVNGVSRIGYMGGGDSALWVDEAFPDILTGKAKTFIRENPDQPFFLYFSFHDIHVPRLPNPRFRGKSEMGPRGDAIAQMDWCTGELIKTLEEAGILENTLVIFTSDNGPVLDDGYEDQAVTLLGDHQPAGPFRGGKYSAYEGGTRVPTITYWPGTIQPGESDALWSQVDLFASLAQLTRQKLSKDAALDSATLDSAAPDSFDMLPVLLGKSDQGRNTMLEESFTLSLRMNEWKYIAPLEGELPDWLSNKDIETGLRDSPQLYNLADDIEEQNNLAQKYPDKLKEMKTILRNIVNQKGSRKKFSH